MIYRSFFVIFISIFFTINIFSKMVNINTATNEQLIELPGIGKTKAQAIIKYRELNGPFKKKEDITNVKGIGKKTFEKMESMITINQEEAELEFSANDLIDMGDEDPTGKFNINLVSLEDLTVLHGIGKSKAESIIKFRDKIKNFRSISELKKVKGIGEATFKKLADFLTVKIDINCIEKDKLLKLNGIDKKFVETVFKIRKKGITIDKKLLKKLLDQYEMKTLSIFFVIIK